MLIVIYCITHLATGLRYVGQTCIGVRRRWALHLSNARRAGRPTVFQTAILQYGADAFSHEEIERVEGQEAGNSAETKWIRTFDCVAPRGFNLDGGAQGCQRHESTRARRSFSIRAAHAAMTPEARERRSAKLRGQMGHSEAKRLAAIRREAARTPEQKLSQAIALWANRKPKPLRGHVHQQRGRFVARVAGFYLGMFGTREEANAALLGRIAELRPCAATEAA